MGKRRYLIHAWVLALAGTLLAPAAAQAQREAIIFGVPFVGRPPVTLPSVYVPWAYGGYYPGYGGMPGYGGYSYPYTAFSAPFGGAYSYSYLTTTPYVTMPNYVPLSSFGYGTPYGFTTALPRTTVYSSAYPTMRDRTYPALTPYTETDTSAQVGPQAARLESYTPAGCAAVVCGSLASYLPAAYNPAGSVLAAATAFSRPPRMRQANYPAERTTAAAGVGPRRAEVDVRLPTADARLWFDGVQMRKTGTSRRFFTPRLEPGSRYTYEVRATWEENGQTRRATRNVYLRPGEVITVDFTRPEKR